MFLGGPGDRLKLLGLKHGEGKRVFDSFDSFQRTLYQGGWRHGLRHGIGVLRYNREHIQARRYEAVPCVGKEGHLPVIHHAFYRQRPLRASQSLESLLYDTSRPSIDLVTSTHLQGHWRGIWWGGRQHGLQLWCRTDEEGKEVEATPFLFKQDIKVWTDGWTKDVYAIMGCAD